MLPHIATWNTYLRLFHGINPRCMKVVRRELASLKLKKNPEFSGKIIKLAKYVDQKAAAQIIEEATNNSYYLTIADCKSISNELKRHSINHRLSFIKLMPEMGFSWNETAHSDIVTSSLSIGEHRSLSVDEISTLLSCISQLGSNFSRMTPFQKNFVTSLINSSHSKLTKESIFSILKSLSTIHMSWQYLPQPFKNSCSSLLQFEDAGVEELMLIREATKHLSALDFPMNEFAFECYIDKILATYSNSSGFGYNEVGVVFTSHSCLVFILLIILHFLFLRSLPFSLLVVIF